MKKILIFGSCVSRDALEFNFSESYKLVGYLARSSLATLSSNSVEKNEYTSNLNNITSIFQRRMVEYDFNKGILDILNKSIEFDILLMDLIDERFHLAVLNDNFYVTRSNEFLKASIQPKSTINTHSDKFFALWKKGAKIFLDSLVEKQLIHKLVVQKAYWTNKLDNGNLIQDISDEKVKEENDKLEKMYNFLKIYLKEDQFITIPESLIVSKSGHKWGISAFHYIDEYYTFINEKLFS